MKRKNNRGFMLMESLIVAVFVLSIFNFIYRNGVPLMGEYERRYNYDDIDSVYAANLIRNMLVSDANLPSLTQGILEGEVTYRDITDCSLWNQVELCNALKEELDIVPSTKTASADGKIYLTRYELSKLKDEVKKGNAFAGNTERGIKTYVEYLPKFTTTSVTQGYRLLIVRNIVHDNGESQKYANIEVIL